MQTTFYPLPTPLYHITHGRNLARIIRDGGLHCYRSLSQASTEYENIAFSHIQDRRARKIVPMSNGKTLHEYVPFYFGVRSPMLNTISRGNVDHTIGSNPRERQRPILYLVTSAQAIANASLAFSFSDGHAVMDFSTFFNSLDQLHNIDWPLMQAEYWNDTRDEPDRKRRRQAEFLVEHFFPWSLISEICVYDEAVQKGVEEIMIDLEHRPIVHVKRDWYY